MPEEMPRQIRVEQSARQRGRVAEAKMAQHEQRRQGNEGEREQEVHIVGEAEVGTDKSDHLQREEVQIVRTIGKSDMSCANGAPKLGLCKYQPFSMTALTHASYNSVSPR